MRTISEIKTKFPTIYEILGSTYIEALKNEQGALAKRATINPFFSILYVTTDEEKNNYVERCFSEVIEKNSITLDRLQRFRDEKQHVNIQNFINEITMLRPLFGDGKFLVESNIGVTPDFVATLLNFDTVFECVSVNEDKGSQKQRNIDIQDTNTEFKEWKKDNPNGGVFSTIHEQSPYGKVTFEKIVDKIRKKKSSKQVKSYKYKGLVMSFKNMMFADSQECLPNISTNYDGVHSGLVYPAFYGKKNDLIFKSNSFEGEKHDLFLLKSDGKFRRKSEYNLCILDFPTKNNEDYKEYVFFENIGNPMPVELINKLCDMFNPYETHSVMKKFIVN